MNNKIMESESKKANWTLGISLFAVAIILIFWFKGCDNNVETIKVPVPEVKGKFDPVKPIHDTIFLTKFVKSKPIQNSNDEFAQAEINRLLKEYNDLDAAFSNANDSLQQIIYSKVIGPKLFSHTFNNDTLNATVKGIVANGEVDKLKLDYTIKTRSIDVKVPQTVFRLMGGVEAGMSKSFNNFNAKANIGFQNKKGNIITISADSDQRFYLGYSMSIFSIKR
jgi:hypothetical protein